MAFKRYGVLSNFRQFLSSLRGRGMKYIFHGSQDEWDALSAAEQDKYDQAEIEDEGTGGIYAVDKVEDDNMNAVTSNAVYELSAIGDWVDVSSTIVDLNSIGTVSGTPTARYRRIGPHLMAIDFRFTIKYTASVSAGTEREESFFTFKIPADISHGDAYVSITGYTRANAGILNPFLSRRSVAADATEATVEMRTKVLHTEARAANATEDFNINSIVVVERWLN